MLYVRVIVPRTSVRLVAFLALLQRTAKNAISAAAEFFSARLSNPPPPAAPMPVPWRTFSPGSNSKGSS